MKALSVRAEYLTEQLQEHAGKDNLEDRFRVGYITAVKDILNC